MACSSDAAKSGAAAANVCAISLPSASKASVASCGNERAAAAAGVNVAGTKALSFAIAAAIAGLGGCVIAYRSGSADQDRFTYSQSLLFFAFAYLGGIARVSGALIGGLLVSGGLAFT